MTATQGTSTDKNANSNVELDNDDTSSEEGKDTLEKHEGEQVDVEKVNQIREQENEQADENIKIDKEEAILADNDGDSADSSDVSKPGLLTEIKKNWSITTLRSTLQITKRVSKRKHAKGHEETGGTKKDKEDRLCNDLRAIGAEQNGKRKADDDDDEEQAGRKKKKLKTKDASAKDNDDDANGASDELPTNTVMQSEEKRDNALERICENLETTSVLGHLLASMRLIGVTDNAELD
ncbi:hypothetical protein G6011_05037 [Alternaria panax]|uniref:Uncharacterized protein n=1 Tax=Alternaria panax TaxID=48097 RepID=A0AAD4I7Y3_9PLEO|nr:hypothetical protein G6011_05037 [Alternaria panax]